MTTPVIAPAEIQATFFTKLILDPARLDMLASVLFLTPRPLGKFQRTVIVSPAFSANDDASLIKVPFGYQPELSRKVGFASITEIYSGHERY
jgi:hypothetical protein